MKNPSNPDRNPPERELHLSICGSPGRSHPAELRLATTCSLDWLAALPATTLFLFPLYFFSSSPLLLFSSPHLSVVQSASLFVPVETPPSSIDSPDSTWCWPKWIIPHPITSGPGPGRLFFPFSSWKVRPPVESATRLISNEPARTPARSAPSWSLLLPPLSLSPRLVYKPLEIAILGSKPRPLLWSSPLLSTSPHSVESPRLDLPILAGRRQAARRGATRSQLPTSRRQRRHHDRLWTSSPPWARYDGNSQPAGGYAGPREGCLRQADPSRGQLQ